MERPFVSVLHSNAASFMGRKVEYFTQEVRLEYVSSLLDGLIGLYYQDLEGEHLSRYPHVLVLCREAPDHSSKLQCRQMTTARLVTCACLPELLDALARVYARAAVRQYLIELEAREAGAASPVKETAAASAKGGA